MANNRTLIQSEKSRKERLFVQWVIAAVLFQLIIAALALWHNAFDAYGTVLPFQLGLELIGLVIAWRSDGNYRIVIYAMTLLSIGQLIQVCIYHKPGQDTDGLTLYLKDYSENMIITIAVMAAAWWVFTLLPKFLASEKSMLLLIGLFLLMIAGIFYLVRFSPLRAPENGAYLAVRIGGKSLQLMEFVKPFSVFLLAGMLFRPRLNNWELTGILAVLIGVAAGAGLCNEFGTLLVVTLAGAFLIWIFQHRKYSWAIIGIIIGLCVCGMIAYLYSMKTYDEIAREASPETFAVSYTYCVGDRDNLAKKVKEYAGKKNEKELIREEQRIDEELRKKGICLDDKPFTFANLSYYISQNVQNVFITDSIKQVEPENYAASYHCFMDIMTVLAEKDAGEGGNFRSWYIQNVIKGGLYNKAARTAYEMEVEEKIGNPMRRIAVDYVIPAVSKYQGRFTGFLHPEEAKGGEADQVNAALAAIATGGVMGHAQQTYTREVPMWDSDMVFSATVAEMGLVVAIPVLLLLLLIVHEMIFTGVKNQSYFLQAVCLGLGFIWAIQSILIVAGNLRLFVLSGVTLPLIAKGGFSIMDSLLMVELVLFISTSSELENAACTHQVGPGLWYKLGVRQQRHEKVSSRIRRNSKEIRNKIPETMEKGKRWSKKVYDDRYDLYSDVLEDEKDGE